MPRTIGIDLGTSTTCMAIVEDARPRVIPVGTSSVIPSYIHLREDGRILIGDMAKSEAIADPYNTIWATKRLIGRGIDEKGVAECIENLTYKLSGDGAGNIVIQGRGKTFSPEWVASLILRFVVNEAGKHLEEKVSKAIITVPGTFNKQQRNATINAAKKVGLEVTRLVNEPTAAAMAWGYSKNAGQTVAVFDLGGGTLDVSVLQIGEGSYKLLAAGGDPWLGGEDFDNILVKRVAADFKKKHGINVYSDKIAHQRVKDQCELAKKLLSQESSARVFIPTIAPDISRVADVDYTITREDFDQLISGLVDRAMKIFKKTLKKADMKQEDIDNVLMVGGMTRVPLVREKMEEILGRPPETSVNPDEAVAKGAAVLAGAVDGNKIAIKAPMSTKPEEEYLSGDIDIHDMYAEAVQQSQQKQEQEHERQQQQQAYGWPPQPGMPYPGMPQPGYPQPGVPPQPMPYGQQAGTEWNPVPPPQQANPGQTVIQPQPAPQQQQQKPIPEATVVENQPKSPAPSAKGQTLEGPGAQLLLEVLANSVSPQEIAGMMAKRGGNGSGGLNDLTAGVTIEANSQEEVRIKVFGKDGKGNRVPLGAFYVRGITNGPNSPPKIQVSFSVSKDAPFAINKNS